MNLYTYVHNNPLIYVDPTGNWCESADGYWSHSGACNSSTSTESDDMLHDGDLIKMGKNFVGPLQTYSYPFELRFARWWFGDAQAFESANSVTQEQMWEYAKSQWVYEILPMTLAIAGPVDTGITIAGIFTGGTSTVVYTIGKQAVKGVTKKWGKNAIEIFAKAANKGIVGPTGQSGIKKLTGTITKNKQVYTHEIKVRTKEQGDYRIYGYQDSNGHFIFDYFDTGLH